MDKTVMIVGAIAIIAILGFTLILNPFGSPVSSSQSTEPSIDVTEVPDATTKPEDKQDDTSPSTTHTPEDDIDYINATYGIMPEKVEGDCQLYIGIQTDKYECFGRAGAYEVLATNEYKVAESEEYFCKATEFGCKLYQKVTFNLN